MSSYSLAKEVSGKRKKYIDIYDAVSEQENPSPDLKIKKHEISFVIFN
jgi:hypothetical protein